MFLVSLISSGLLSWRVVMGQSVYNLCRPLCDSLGPNSCRNWAGQKPQQAGPHVTGLDFVKGLFCIWWNDHFFLIYLYGGLYLLILHIEAFLHFLNEAYLINMDDLFDLFMDSICNHFIEYFYVYVHKEIWSIILFLFWILCGLGIRVTVAS